MDLLFMVDQVTVWSCLVPSPGASPGEYTSMNKQVLLAQAELIDNAI